MYDQICIQKLCSSCMHITITPPNGCMRNDQRYYIDETFDRGMFSRIGIIKLTTVFLFLFVLPARDYLH